MKLTELMSGRTPDKTFSGFITADDWVLAVDVSGAENTAVGDYETVQAGIVKVEANLNPITSEKQYIRSGQATLKTGVQRVFDISGDRCIGDPFQDWALSLAMRYGLGQRVIVPYVYFCLLTGEGECGKVSVLIRSDGSTGAGEGSGFLLTLRQAGEAPAAYTWSPDTASPENPGGQDAPSVPGGGEDGEQESGN